MPVRGPARHARALLARLLWCVLGAAGAAGAAGGAGAAGDAAAPARTVGVTTIKLSLSNVHLLRGARAVLVDAGGKGDLPALAEALEAQGLAWTDVAAVIVTHGHSDHAGLAAEIRRRSGATLVLGRGDVAMAAAGHNDDLQPTGFTARILMHFAIDPAYEAFAPDIVVDAELDLARFGIAGRVRQMPGHTPGSLVVELDDGRALVGDIMLGGFLGGAIWPTRAGEHYFHTDRARNRANVVALLSRPLHTFYLGHGGPVDRTSVLAWLDIPDPRAGP